MMRIAIPLLALLLVPSLVQANTPPEPKSLAERIGLATHVVVGTAKKVRVVRGIPDGNEHIDLKEVIPEPENIDGFGQYVEVDIEVNEALYPSKWQAPKAPKIVRYLFGGGIFSVNSVREDTVGKRLIYLMSIEHREELNDADNIFFPSYGWNLADAIESKKDILELIRERVQKEQKTAPPK